MYKAYIEPDLKTAHLKIYNTFNPFSGFMDPTYILKSAQRVSKETIHSLLKVILQSQWAVCLSLHMSAWPAANTADCSAPSSAEQTADSRKARWISPTCRQVVVCCVVNQTAHQRKQSGHKAHMSKAWLSNTAYVSNSTGAYLQHHCCDCLCITRKPSCRLSTPNVRSQKRTTSTCYRPMRTPRPASPG